MPDMKEVVAYLRNFQLDSDEKGALQKINTLIKESTLVITGGKGRSGYVAEIGARVLRTPTLQPFYYRDAGLPPLDQIKKHKTVALLISSSGTTGEMVQLARELKEIGVTIVGFTSFATSPLAKLSDLVVDLPKRPKSPEGTYFERQVVTADQPTMGDLPEEKALFYMYLLGNLLRDTPIKPDEEIRELQTWMDANREELKVMKNWLNAYWNSGILLVSKGCSNSVASMIANRGSHYQMNLRMSHDPTSPPLDRHELALIISGSADEEYGRLIEKIHDKMSLDLGTKKAMSAVVAVVGRKAGWLKTCDANLVLGGGNDDYRMIRDEKPQAFYFRAAVVLNILMRNIAAEKGLTKKYAELRHINI
ncbi:MAG TPA: SIS domain-containing protein [archaeon]|nr:SIS domain-containing protein [archaeon]